LTNGQAATTVLACCRAQRPSGRTGDARLRIVNRNAPNAQSRNLKKQAKLYLRWHRDGYYPVAARIRAVLPSYRHLNDREVLAHSFRLSDAHELIARKAGLRTYKPKPCLSQYF
jgi:hypothetical protein